jgi:hypothetical protein
MEKFFCFETIDSKLINKSVHGEKKVRKGAAVSDINKQNQD